MKGKIFFTHTKYVYRFTKVSGKVSTVDLCVLNECLSCKTICSSHLECFQRTH